MEYHYCNVIVIEGGGADWGMGGAAGEAKVAEGLGVEFANFHDGT
jgi:hypothetical protein